jgi:hypothetical protein
MFRKFLLAGVLSIAALSAAKCVAWEPPEPYQPPNPYYVPVSPWAFVDWDEALERTRRSALTQSYALATRCYYQHRDYSGRGPYSKLATDYAQAAWTWAAKAYFFYQNGYTRDYKTYLRTAARSAAACEAVSKVAARHEGSPDDNVDLARQVKEMCTAAANWF